MVKKSPPRLLLWLAWICSQLREVSDGGGVVGGVVVGAGAGGGGAGVVVLAGAAGAVRRADRGFGASTVTCGIETAGGVAGSACGVSGAGC